jgi:hypothetical protein
LHNPLIDLPQYYAPIMTYLLQFWAGASLTLVIDSSMLWDEYCLIEVCFLWGGRSLPIAHQVLKHGCTTVGFEQYRPVLEAALTTLTAQVQVTLLADRGFICSMCSAESYDSSRQTSLCKGVVYLFAHRLASLTLRTFMQQCQN